MRLHNASKAVVEIAKLQGYCLSTEHPEGRHKARVFYSVLGPHCPGCRGATGRAIAAARANEAIVVERDAYGQRYVVDFVMRRRGREAAVRSA